ncbi:MAG: hypothetical protein K9M02_13020 [Thiohalocapsa sp.]|nr:hypothetical protein [Thiohalocapsa sp.]
MKSNTRRARRARMLALLSALILLPAGAAADSAPPAELNPIEADITAIQAAFDAGTLTAEALTKTYLGRIAAYDAAGPVINSLITVNAAATAEARALDAERASSGPRGPLHGIPVVISDNLNTYDLPTTGGAAAMRGNEPVRDAFVVKQLRDAGAVILGKANLSEMSCCGGRPAYSSAGGQTRNPYNLRRAPGGGSSGPAAAVAANLAVLALGTDTAGSLRAPAAATALVGIRPTLGLVSRAGSIPVALSLDTPGPLARGVADAAALLGVIARVDEADLETAAAVAPRVDDYTAFLDVKAIEGAHLGVIRAYRGGNGEVDRAFARAVQTLEALGAVIVEIVLPEHADDWPGLVATLVETEYRDQMNAYLQHTEGGMPHNLLALLRMSRSPLIAGSDRPVSEGRLQAYASALESPGLADLGYLHALSRRVPGVRAAMAELIDAAAIDALVLPTMLCPPSSLLDNYDSSYECDVDDPYLPAYLASLAGLPELTLPMAYTGEGLPLGLSFVGPAFAESRLLGLAYAYEQAARVRRAPQTTPVVIAGDGEPVRGAKTDF